MCDVVVDVTSLSALDVVDMKHKVVVVVAVVIVVIVVVVVVVVVGSQPNASCVPRFWPELRPLSQAQGEGDALARCLETRYFPFCLGP